MFYNCINVLFKLSAEVLNKRAIALHNYSYFRLKDDHYNIEMNIGF